MLEVIVYVSLALLAGYFTYNAGYSNGVDKGWEQGRAFERRWNDGD
jgi:hypothetical protein